MPMEDIIKQFNVKIDKFNICPVKVGHINDSFIIENLTDSKTSYFLQKINHHIFKDIEGLQGNIQIVTSHLRNKYKEAGLTDFDRRTLRLVPAKDGKLFYKDDKGYYWRIYINIQNTYSYEIINPDLAYKAGVAFGNFQSMLSDLDTDKLIETIPYFHNMEFRLEQFSEAVRKNAARRLGETQWMAEEIEKRAKEMCIQEELYRSGKLPKRINHCDTKVNNLLFNQNDEAICIVDLDTVMPGFVLSDFGDFIRTGANTGAEDDPNLDNIGINLEIFEAYTKGYLQKAGFLTQIELDNLAYGAKLLTYMQTVRFFTDYLNGDVYYKIQSKDHNWQRTLAQFRLLQDMEENFEKMQQIVLYYSKR